jgi:hypothetical protein
MTINEGFPGATEANSRTMRGGRSLFPSRITQCIYPTPRFEWLDPACEDSAPPRGAGRQPESLRSSGLRLSPFDEDFPDRRRGDTTLSAKKISHEGLSVDKGSPRYNPLLSTSACTSGIVQIHTHDRRKGSTKGVEGKKAGYVCAQGEGSLQRTRCEDVLRKESTSRDSSREDLLFY